MNFQAVALTCNYVASNLTGFVICDIGNPMPAGAKVSVRIHLFECILHGEIMGKKHIGRICCINSWILKSPVVEDKKVTADEEFITRRKYIIIEKIELIL